MNGRKTSWVEAGRWGAWRNLARLRPLPWRPDWEEGMRANGRTRGREEVAATGAPPPAGAVGRTVAWEEAGAVSEGPAARCASLPDSGLRTQKARVGQPSEAED